MTKVIVRNYHNITENGVISMTAKQMDKVKQMEQVQLQASQVAKPLVIKVTPIPLDAPKRKSPIVPDIINLKPLNNGIFNKFVEKSKKFIGNIKNLFKSSKE